MLCHLDVAWRVLGFNQQAPHITTNGCGAIAPKTDRRRLNSVPAARPPLAVSMQAGVLQVNPATGKYPPPFDNFGVLPGPEQTPSDSQVCLQ